MSRGFGTGLGMGLVVGGALGVTASVVAFAARHQSVRRALARWLLRREPKVEFEILQQ